MTHGDAGDDPRHSLTIELLVALARCGLTDHDHRHLRFLFEVPSLRTAVELCRELRRRAPTGIRVRPAPLLPPAHRRWAVTVTTAPTPLTLGAIHLREREMRAIVGRRPGARLVWWKLMLTPEDFARIGPRPVDPA